MRFDCMGIPTLTFFYIEKNEVAVGPLSWANIRKKDTPSLKLFTHFLRKFRFNFILVSFNFIRKMRNKCVIKCLDNNPIVTNFAS